MSQDETHGIPQTSLIILLEYSDIQGRERNQQFIPFCSPKINPRLSLKFRCGIKWLWENDP